MSRPMRIGIENANSLKMSGSKFPRHPPPQAPVLSEPTKAFLNEHQAFYQRYGVG